MVSGSVEHLSVGRWSVSWWSTCQWVGCRWSMGRWSTCRWVVGFVTRCIEKFTTPNIFLALFSLIEKWKKSLNDKGFVVAVLMDMSKAFDTLNHELLIVKLHPHGFKRDSLKLVNDYLSNRWQRAKVNKNFSSWAELIQGVPQGSVLSPLLLNIYFNNLFCLAESNEVYNFANHTTFFACDKDLKTLISRLEHNSHLAIEWFESNYRKLNQEKCHLLVLGYKHKNICAQTGEVKIWESLSKNYQGS